MTTFSDDERLAQLSGAANAWADALRPMVRALDGLADSPQVRPVREALIVAAEHVRIAANLLEAVADATEPHRNEQNRALDETALGNLVRRVHP
jgi:hypothetical protein